MFFASGFLPSTFVCCLQLSACCFLFLACCVLLSLSYLSCFLLFAVSFLLSVSCCLQSHECSLLSISASWFSFTALSFPIAAICDWCFLLFVYFFLLSTCPVPSCVRTLHDFRHFHMFRPLAAVAISFQSHAFFKAIPACCYKGAPFHQHVSSEECLYKSCCLRMGGAAPRPHACSVKEAPRHHHQGGLLRSVCLQMGRPAPSPQPFVQGRPCMTTVRHFKTFHRFP